MWHVHGSGEPHAGVWLENLKERPIGSHMRSWEDNINMDLKEIGWEWVGLD
jgi:hypothetical protein